MLIDILVVCSESYISIIESMSNQSSIKIDPMSFMSFAQRLMKQQ